MEIFLVCLVGAIGGILNCLLVERGFVSPSVTTTESKRTLYDLGFITNIVLGAGAAFVVYVFGTETLPLLKKLGMALLGGVGGGNILASMLQKYQLQLANAKIENLGDIAYQTATQKKP